MLPRIPDIEDALEEEDPTDILSLKPVDSGYYPYRNKIVSPYHYFFNIPLENASYTLPLSVLSHDIVSAGYNNTEGYFTLRARS